MKSHPMWVRGLKLKKHGRLQEVPRSHPMWVRGLKPSACGSMSASWTSHPMWVRGLKQAHQARSSNKRSRTLCGCVD